MTDVVNAFVEDRCSDHAAAIAFYTLFSLPSVLVVAVRTVGAWFGEERAKGQLLAQVRDLLGSGAADEVGQILELAAAPSGGVAAFVGLVALVWSSTAVVSQLRVALDEAWNVAPDPSVGGLHRPILRRLQGFVIVVLLGLGLSLAFAGEVALEAARLWLEARLGAGPGFAFRLVLLGLWWGVFTLLVASTFAILPHVRLRARDVLSGAAGTAALMMAGTVAFGTILGATNPGSAYGAAGALVLVLVWIYYVALVFLVGVEATHIALRRVGRSPAPEPGAVRVRTIVERDDDAPEHGA